MIVCPCLCFTRNVQAGRSKGVQDDAIASASITREPAALVEAVSDRQEAMKVDTTDGGHYSRLKRLLL